MCQLPSHHLSKLLQDLEMKAAQAEKLREEEKKRILAANKEAAKSVLLTIQLQLARRTVR